MRNSFIMSFAVACAMSACRTPDVSSSEVKLDTSGCTPLLDLDNEQDTVKGGRLTVSFHGPNSASCWNVKESVLTISYYWKQQKDSADVSFWTRSGDGAERTLHAGTTCNATLVAGEFECNANATIRERYINQLDVAPVRDGEWDTAGMGKNYFFKLW
ncbi:MAG: hypothetical protein WCI18_16825 [Pseudomonadota bacterium]